jgi:UDP-N-acetylglucosamine 1-carboxyvinyltransferase
MQYFEINGGRKLSGRVTPQGAKNEALQVLCAVLLTDEEVTIENIPEIRDVLRLIELLKNFGVKVKKLSEGNYSFRADDVKLEYLESEDFHQHGSSIRGSVMLLGPLLSRFGKGVIPKPGGDKIGRRRLDTHFNGLMMLGADFNYDATKKQYSVNGKNLKGCFILQEEASVTGTANLLMAASMSEGVTTIYNAACEPYLQQLSKMLQRMGAKIEGIGSNKLIIEGVKSLSGCKHKCLPDMIEIGSFIGLAAMTGSALRIQNVRADQLGIIPSVFRKMGIKFDIIDDDIVIPEQEIYEVETYIDGSILTISDAPWPGFTPDLISIALVVATQAKGNVLIHQKMFESRLFFVDNLLDMGAQIILCDPHRATVMGLAKQTALRGIPMRSPDIRAGVSLLIAALSAEGTSRIYNIEQIDRGYQNFDQRLRELGADIKRLNGSA